VPAECPHDPIHLTPQTCSLCKGTEPAKPKEPHVSECSKCGEPIIWVYSEKGKPMPIDVMPGGDPDRARFRKERTEVDGDRVKGIVHFVRDSEIEDNTRPLYCCHFDTCAERDKEKP
jgi:hypothetical protein